MSMNFTKLFSSITESSIWGESDQTRLVWVTMLAMADRMGRVWASVPGLAHRARVPIAAAETALDVLLAPDRYSRTPDNEGRRIEAIDGGWRILNHAKYRSIRDAEAEREKKNRWAEKQRKTTSADRNRPEETAIDPDRPQETAEDPNSLNAEAEAEAEAEARDNTLRPSARAPKSTPAVAENGNVKPAKPRARNPLFDALAKLDGGAEHLTASAAARVGAKLASICKACPDVTEEEIDRRAGNLRLLFPTVPATASSLEAHWAQCDTAPVNGHNRKPKAQDFAIQEEIHIPRL